MVTNDLDSIGQTHSYVHPTGRGLIKSEVVDFCDISVNDKCNEDVLWLKLEKKIECGCSTRHVIDVSTHQRYLDFLISANMCIQLCLMAVERGLMNLHMYQMFLTVADYCTVSCGHFYDINDIKAMRSSILF